MMEMTNRVKKGFKVKENRILKYCVTTQVHGLAVFGGFKGSQFKVQRLTKLSNPGKWHAN